MKVRRRAVLRVVVVSLAAVATNSLAQLRGKVHRVGYASFRAAPAAMDEAFLQGLRERGYVVGRDVLIEYRWADNDLARFEAQVDELLRLNVDVIVTSATPAVRAAMRATKTVPIVFAAAIDPVGTGLVVNLAHPGGNVTGMSLLSNDLARKRLQLLRELLPGVSRIAVLGSRGADYASVPPSQRPIDRLIAEAQAAGSPIGIAVSARPIRVITELPQATAQMKRDGVQAVIVQQTALTGQHRSEIVELLSRDRLPAIYEARDFVESGGLISYGPDVHDSYRRAAGYVDRIFKGAKAGDLAIEQATKFQLVINLKTANALGLVVPQELLLRADDVIQ